MTSYIFFFNDTAPTEISPLSPHDALPILLALRRELNEPVRRGAGQTGPLHQRQRVVLLLDQPPHRVERLLVLQPPVHQDRKSTRLNSSHANISYAVFCLKKKTQIPSFRVL